MKIVSTSLLRAARTHWSCWLRAAAWASCVAFGTYGTLLLREGWTRFDGAMAWYGAALVSLLAATWTTSPATMALDIRGALRDLLGRRWELLALLTVLGLAIFMRVYDFGYFPPSDGLAFEEAQTGGIAYGILNEGLRPRDFPVAGYLPAAGFALFGESTTSLRAPFIVLGIASVAVFYLLIRELASAPAALFATALFGASRWMALGSRTADELFSGIFFEVLAVYFLVRGLRTGRSWNFIGAGLAAGILMYEYTSYRVLPPLLLAFLALIVSRKLWGSLRSLAPRASAALRQSWQPALALVFAFGLAFSPLLILSIRGERQFGYESFERDIEVRKEGALGGLLPPNWEDRLEWGIETFTRGAESTYQPLTRPDVPLLDPVSAALLVAAVVYGAVFFFRPFRLLFLAWLLAVVVGGSVVPINFNPGRLTAAVPAAFVLVGFMVDDVGRLVGNLAGRRRALTGGWLWLALVPVAAAAFGLNGYSLFAVHAQDTLVRAHYSDRFLATCNYLKERQDSFAYVWSEDGGVDPVFLRSDYSWACEDVRGRALPSFTNTWGLGQGEPGDALLVFVGAPPNEETVQSLLDLAYPEARVNTETVLDPAEQPLVQIYRLPESSLSARHGLLGTYYAGADAEGTPLMRRVDPVQNLEWTGRMPEASGPFSVSWSGLIYLRQAGHRGLQATTENPVQIDLDGEPVFRSGAEGPAISYLNVGWHTIEVTLTIERPEPSFGLTWVLPQDPVALNVLPEDLFPLSPVSGLRHQMIFQDPEGEPAILAGVGWPISLTAPGAAVRFAEQELQQAGLRYVGESWDGYLVVGQEDEISLALQVRNGAASLMVDGQPALEVSSLTDAVQETENIFRLSPGRHRIHLRFDYEFGGLAGARLVSPDQPDARLPLDLFEPR